MIHKLLSLALVFLTLNNCNNQTHSKNELVADESLGKYELELHAIYNKIIDARLENDTISWNVIETENENFEAKFLKYIVEEPKSIAYPFDSLKENLKIVTSSDRLLRIYSWDTWRGGTMREFKNLFQYKSQGRLFAEIVEDSGHGEGEYIPFYSKIFTLESNDNTYYLCVYNGIYSSKDASQSIKILQIENDKLKEVDLIQTEKGLTSSIDVYFDFFSVVDRPERPLELITYNAARQEFYIPVLTENEKVTNQYTTYKFNGQYFKIRGN